MTVHPTFLPNRASDTLVATARSGHALYCMRDWRMGGRHYTLRAPDGSTRNWDTWDDRGRTKYKAPPEGGRWKWLDPETREAYG